MTTTVERQVTRLSYEDLERSNARLAETVARQNAELARLTQHTDALETVRLREFERNARARINRVLGIVNHNLSPTDDYERRLAQMVDIRTELMEAIGLSLKGGQQ